MNNKLTRAYVLSLKEAKALKSMPAGTYRDQYLKQIRFQERIFVYLTTHCPSELQRLYICPVSKVRFEERYVDKLIAVTMRKVAGDPSVCELAVGKEIVRPVLEKTVLLFDRIPAVTAHVRAVNSSGNLFIAVSAK